MTDPNIAVDYIIKNAERFAQAKAARIYLEGFAKTKKALLMAQSDDKAANAREQYAYAHIEYQQLLEGLKAAIEVEETLKWHMEAARMRVDIWRSTEASNRNIERVTR
jgi:hypothetical protein